MIPPTTPWPPTMRIPLILFLLSIVGLQPLSANTYIDAGAPAPDREWRGTDYESFIGLLAGGKVPLPKLSDPEGAAVLKRICSTDNLSLARNENLPLQARTGECMTILQNLSQLIKLYYGQNLSSTKVSGEVSLLMAQMLEAAALGIELIEKQEIPKDDRYEVRMQGLAQVKRGTTEIFLGAYQTIAVDKEYTHAEKVHVLRAAAGTSKSFVKNIPAGSKAELVVKFKALRETFTGEVERGYIDTIITNLSPAPDSGI